MQTVLGFDSWTEGSHHYVRLVRALEHQGYRLVLIHIGSWGHDCGRPTEEAIGDLLVRDVAYYEGMSLKEVLVHEAPAAVVFLSTRAFAHQAFNRYAEHLGIPTLHLYHGLVNVADVSNAGRYPFQLSWAQQFRLMRNRVIKNAFVLWPQYWRALLQTGAPLSRWYWFLREIYQKAVRNCSGVAPPDASTTEGCVYTQADLQHMVKFYNMPHQHVHVVGNPDLERFRLKVDDMAVGLSGDRLVIDEVFYLTTALLESGVVYSNMDEVVADLSELRDALAEQGFRLVVKLHPSQVSSALPRRLLELGVDLCGNNEFSSRLRSAACVITEPSSAAVIPALMGLPLFLAQFGKLAEQRYGAVLTGYPRARYLRDPRGVRAEMGREAAAVDSAIVKTWISENSGPLPAEEMPNRVASVIDAMVRERRISPQLRG